MKGILGRKRGMSRVFTEDGRVQPVTVIEAGPCVVTQVKTSQVHGYQAIQLGFEEYKRLNKPESGHLTRSAPMRHLKEFRVDDLEDLQVGQQILVDIFSDGDSVRISGTSKGRGFAGGIKRHNFKGGPKTHGQSDRWRAPGSIGAGTTPGRVYKGTRMAGHMGNHKVTMPNLKIVGIDKDRNLLFIKGSVPGSNNGMLVITGNSKGN